MTSVDPFVRGLMEIIRQEQLKPASLSKQAGLSDSAIRKMFEKPATSPRISSAINIAKQLDRTVEDIIAVGEARATAERPTAAITGRVVAGAEVELWSELDAPMVKCPSELASPSVAAIEINGTDMEPVYSAGDLLFYAPRPNASTLNAPIPDDAIGQRCLVLDEEDRAWVRQLKSGDEPGLFHLISLNPGANTMWNRRLKWAARIRLHWPAELAKKL